MSDDRFESVMRESMEGTVSFSWETDDGERGHIILASPVVDAKDISCLTVDRRSARVKEMISVSSGLSLLGLAAVGLRVLLSSSSTMNERERTGIAGGYLEWLKDAGQEQLFIPFSWGCSRKLVTTTSHEAGLSSWLGPSETRVYDVCNASLSSKGRFCTRLSHINV